jgi:hypothetical protein
MELVRHHAHIATALARGMVVLECSPILVKSIITVSTKQADVMLPSPLCP